MAAAGHGGATLADAVAALDARYDPALAEPWDAVGLEEGGPVLCDVAHFATEEPWLQMAADLLERDLSCRIRVAASERTTDPWSWHVGEGHPAGPPAG